MRKNYFTLLELLVVISIIVMLAAMLLPALNKAKETGRKITCMNNLSQLGKAFSLYLSDNNDFFPPYRDYGSPEKTWYYGSPDRGYLAEYLGLANVLDRIGVLGVSGGKMWRNRFRCPSQSDPPSGTEYFTYGYNGQVYGYSKKITKYKAPSMTCLLSESIEYPVVIYYTTSGTYIMGFRHNNGANVLFCDGHVEWKKNTDIPDKTYDPMAYKNRFWEPENY